MVTNKPGNFTQSEQFNCAIQWKIRLDRSNSFVFPVYSPTMLLLAI